MLVRAIRLSVRAVRLTVRRLRLNTTWRTQFTRDYDSSRVCYGPVSAPYDELRQHTREYDVWNAAYDSVYAVYGSIRTIRSTVRELRANTTRRTRPTA